MTSLLLKKYGDLEKVLSTSTTKKPTPKKNEVLIEVKAIALNPIDLKIAQGDLRAILPPILEKPRLGFDISGIIERVGNEVKHFKNGDEVYLRLPLYQGSGFSPFVIANVKHVALKPENIGFEEAASIPLVALTSVQALSDYAKAKAGQSLLIDSGSGGVG
ncbi:MAG: alcohol dehydrogenase catalytic domain-containing protein, partial [Bacteroidota bacterium]